MYERGAFRLILDEANKVACQLGVPEKLPITERDLVGRYITPAPLARRLKAIGSVTTSNYCYYISRDYKFSFLEGTHGRENLLRWRGEFTWPASLLDTNAAHQRATQWLAAVSMDAKALDHDCELHVETPPVLGPVRGGAFVPVYAVYWTKRTGGGGSAASLVFFAPSNTLLQLRVEDARYILRHPMQLPDL